MLQDPGMRTKVDLLKSAYRTLVPKFIRKSKPAGKLASFAANLLGHDAMYDTEYYTKGVEGPAARSAGAMTDTILTDFKPKSVVDVGCGTGHLLMVLKDRGCDVFGLEYSEAGLEYCRNRGLDVRKFDLEKDSFQDGRKFDVAVSVEVAEHLPASVADSYVGLLTRLSDRIVFTAAPPGQGGRDHVNEQPPEYWITKFAAHKFEQDHERTNAWRSTWRERDVQDWYHQNLMIFRRA